MLTKEDVAETTRDEDRPSVQAVDDGPRTEEEGPYKVITEKYPLVPIDVYRDPYQDDEGPAYMIRLRPVLPDVDPRVWEYLLLGADPYDVEAVDTIYREEPQRRCGLTCLTVTVEDPDNKDVIMRCVDMAWYHFFGRVGIRSVTLVPTDPDAFQVWCLPNLQREADVMSFSLPVAKITGRAAIRRKSI